MPRDWDKRRKLAAGGGWCVRCGDRGASVDHIVGHADGGSDDPSNLQWLCEPCHKKKTGEDNARRWKK